MVMDVIMPQLGETVSEGKVSVWHAKVGDEVSTEHGERLVVEELDGLRVARVQVIGRPSTEVQHATAGQDVRISA